MGLGTEPSCVTESSNQRGVTISRNKIYDVIFN